MQGKVTKRDNLYIKTFEDERQVENIRQIYENIKHLPAVPPIEFTKNSMITAAIPSDTLLQWFSRKDLQDTQLYAHQLIKFVVSLNQLGYAHRDLNPKNILLANGRLFVVDWDYVTANPVPLMESFDLTGNGLPNPHRIAFTCLFKSYEIKKLTRETMASLTPEIVKLYTESGTIPSVAEMLEIELTDFQIKL